MKELTVLTNNDMTIEELAYQLTAYEKWGFIDYEEGIIDLVLSDYLEEAEASELIWRYNEYLENNGYTDDLYYYNDDYFFTEFFNSAEPMRIIQAIYFGHYNYNDDYVQFNGYGNLDSISEWALVDQIKRDTGFLYWLYSNDEAFEELREEENKALIINETLKLVKEGY